MADETKPPLPHGMVDVSEEELKLFLENAKNTVSAETGGQQPENVPGPGGAGAPGLSAPAPEPFTISLTHGTGAGTVVQGTGEPAPEPSPVPSPTPSGLPAVGGTGLSAVAPKPFTISLTHGTGAGTVVQGTGGRPPDTAAALPAGTALAAPPDTAATRAGWAIAAAATNAANLLTKYQRPKSGAEIIGLRSSPAPLLIHFTNLTQTVFDYTSRTGEARILLTNATGASVTIRGCIIIGAAVSRVSEYLHDYFIDWEMIAQDGERTFELGNRMIADRDLVDKLADWHWKWNRAKLHIYIVSMVGFQSFFEPGEWYTLDVSDTAGTEDINSLVECYIVRCSLDASGRMGTSVAFREVLEDWVKDSNETARFVSRPPVWQRVSNWIATKSGLSGSLGF